MSSRLEPARRMRRRLRRLAAAHSGPNPDLIKLTDEDRRYLGSLYDDSVPLPTGAEATLKYTSPRLQKLRATYSALQLPVTQGSRWHSWSVENSLDLRWFRGETLYVWHYRELPRITELKYFILARYVQERDSLKLLNTLEEDGAFGCWTFSYPKYGRVSRDLLESINEINFLERSLQLSKLEQLRVLDIGAGYGRLAHRMTEAYPQLTDHCCVDAIPESTFLSEYYLDYRGCTPRARVVGLDAVESQLGPGSFDLALNIHSFSECTYEAVEWWVGQLKRLEVPSLLLVPNEPTELLTLESDGSRRDFAPLLKHAGYRLTSREPTIDDEGTRGLLKMNDDHFHLYSLEH